MGTGHDTVRRVRQSVGAVGSGRWLLAVSGGMDSMVLLDAAAATLGAESLTVATFDHGTGPWASAASALVTARAGERGVPCVSAKAEDPGRSESVWRAQRWQFLNSTASGIGATVVTAHTRDDQIETVVIRALRGAGPRGLAGLFAESRVARPMLGITRSEVACYALSMRISHAEDPSNGDRRHLRNRVRLDLLPALERVSPGFSASMLSVAEKAGQWRARMEALALTFPMMTESPQIHSFDRSAIRHFEAEQLRCLWPALAARAGVVLDRRGTERLAQFTIEGETGQQIQLAGGVRVHMERKAITFRSAGIDG